MLVLRILNLRLRYLVRHRVLEALVFVKSLIRDVDHLSVALWLATSAICRWILLRANRFQAAVLEALSSWHDRRYHQLGGLGGGTTVLLVGYLRQLLHQYVGHRVGILHVLEGRIRQE